MFPFELREHHLLLLNNNAHFTIDARLAFHFTLYCKKCDKEESVRGRLPPKYSEVERIQTAKIIALGAFRDECVVGNRNIYIPGRHKRM